MIRILLIRHAQPEGAWGVADDPGLTERGRAQAEGAAMMLARVAPLFLVSSPLRRCRETAIHYENSIHQSSADVTGQRRCTHT